MQAAGSGKLTYLSFGGLNWSSLEQDHPLQSGLEVRLWVSSHLRSKMPGIRPYHPSLPLLLTAPGPGFCCAGWHPVITVQCGELPVLGLP